MYRFTYVFPFLFLVGCISSAPLAPIGPQSTTMERANKMIVRTDDDLETAYRRLGQLLVQRNFTLENSDPVLLSLSTDFKEVGGNRMKVNAFITESEGKTQIEMKGQLRLAINVGQSLFGEAAAEDAPTLVEKRGMSGSPYDVTWRELESLARAYPGGAVLYARD